MKILYKLALVLLLMSCVQETHVKSVTFKVDMNGIDNVGNVGIRGSFTSNQWNETVPLTDEDNDGIYEITISEKPAVNQIQFKFVNQNSDYELKGKDNRVLKFEYRPETISYIGVFDNHNEVQIIKN